MSKDNVVSFPGRTILDIPPDRVLSEALEEGLSGVVVMGYDSEGREYFASSYADGQPVNWLADRLKYKLLKGLDEMVEGDE